MAYESRVMQLKDLGLLLECKVVFQATRDTWSNLGGGRCFSSGERGSIKRNLMHVFLYNQ
jgi:hypothetical protein